MYYLCGFAVLEPVLAPCGERYVYSVPGGRCVMRRSTVLLADDHTIMTDGLKRLLEPDFEVAGAVENGRELVEAAKRIQPDVVVLDISMPELNGIEAAVQIRKEVPTTRLVFLTMHADATYVKAAFRAGASGYVLKRCASAELVDSIHEVLRGRRYVTPEVAEDANLGKLQDHNATGALTAREREVLQLVAAGKSAKEIGAALTISPRTVAFHKSNMMQKLQIHTTAELTKFALLHGIEGEL